MNNRFAWKNGDHTSPAIAHYDGDTAKSDTVNLPEVCREVFVGVGGDVTLTDTSGFTGTFKNVQSGSSVIGFFTRVWSTGTTATAIILGV